MMINGSERVPADFLVGGVLAGLLSGILAGPLADLLAGLLTSLSAAAFFIWTH